MFHIYITTTFYGRNCKLLTVPLSRNCQKRLTQKEDQIKSGADPEIQKGVAGTVASNMDTFYFTENSSDIIENITKRGVGVGGGGGVFGAWSLLSASNLVPRAFPLKNSPTHVLRENPWGGGCSASALNPPMQRNITRKPRSHISKAGRLRSEEQRTTLNGVPTDI